MLARTFSSRSGPRPKSPTFYNAILLSLSLLVGLLVTPPLARLAIALARTALADVPDFATTTIRNSDLRARLASTSLLEADLETEGHFPLTPLHPWQTVREQTFTTVVAPMKPRPYRIFGARREQRVALVGNCKNFLDRNGVWKESNKMLKFGEIGEQLTSSLPALHSMLKIANNTQRVIVGPFVTERNRYSSSPDTFAFDHSDSEGPSIDALPRQFLSNFWEIDGLLSVYENLCMLVSDPPRSGLCEDRKTLSYGITRPESVPESKELLLHARVKVVRENEDLDLEHLLLHDKDLSRAACADIRGFQRLFLRGDSHMYEYEGSQAPPIPLPSWFSESRKMSDRAEAFKQAMQDEALGERLYWLFSPSLNIRKKARDFWRNVKTSREKYMSLHLRLEFVYSPGSAKCSNHPLASLYPSLNMCVFEKCPPRTVLKKLANHVRALQDAHKIDHENHLFVARDFGQLAPSYSLRGSPLDGISGQEAGLNYFHDIAGDFTEHHGSGDPPTDSLVDMVLLIEAEECLRVGGGSFGLVVDYYREARGRRKCRLFKRIDYETCQLLDSGLSNLGDEGAWKQLTGQSRADMSAWLAHSIDFRAQSGVPIPNLYEELLIPREMFNGGFFDEDIFSR